MAIIIMPENGDDKHGGDHHHFLAGMLKEHLGGWMMAVMIYYMYYIRVNFLFLPCSIGALPHNHSFLIRPSWIRILVFFWKGVGFVLRRAGEERNSITFTWS